MRFARNRAKDFAGGLGAPLRIGLVPTIDCAPVAVAQELGLFRAHGLNVRLSREVGWATIRERLLHEEIDAAVAHAGMLFSIYFGLGTVRRPCLTGLMLGHNGGAITLSRELWDLGARDAQSTGDLIRRFAGRRRFKFGVVIEFSVQHYLLSEWLRAGGVDPVRDVRLATVPSSLIYQSLRAGHLDGYCVAEPWNSLAALQGDGVIPVLTGEVRARHPDKVLLVLQDFAEARQEEHEKLIAALMEASRFCQAPENRSELISLLAGPAYLDVPEAVLANVLRGPFETGAGPRPFADAVLFDSWDHGAPTRAQARWVFELMQTLCNDEQRTHLRAEAMRRVFREDIFLRGAARVRSGREAGLRGVPAGLPSAAGPGQTERPTSLIFNQRCAADGAHLAEAAMV